MISHNLKYVFAVTCLLVVSQVTEASVSENDDTTGSNTNNNNGELNDAVESYDVNKNLLTLGDHIAAEKASANLLDPINLLTKQLFFEITKLNTKNYQSVFTQSFKSMQSTQKYYLIALLSSIVSNLHELNDILNEIISEHEVDVNEYLIRKYENIANTKRSLNRLFNAQELHQKHKLQHH